MKTVPYYATYFGGENSMSRSALASKTWGLRHIIYYKMGGKMTKVGEITSSGTRW